jgi:pilus assembly protein CpaE
VNAVETTPQILVVGSDPLLRAEFEAATAGLRKWRPVVHFVRGQRQGVETARNRRPDVVCVQLDADPSQLRMFAEDIYASAPGSVVVALYRPDGLGFGESEHTVIIEAMRAQVQDFLRRPLATGELQQLLDRVLDRPKVEHRTVGKVVSIVSNKGGVGKSTISVNLACELAKRFPRRVLLVDVSLHLGSCAPMLDISPATTLASAARERSRLDETLLRELAVSHECGLDLLAAPVDAVEASEIDDEGLSRVLTLARRAYDYVIVDTFPMLDGLILAILDVSDRAYVIVQNTVPNVVGAARLLPVLQHVGFPRDRTRVVLNNNFQKCPGGLTTADAAERLGRGVDHVIGYQKRLVVALNTGRPYVLKASPLYGFGKAIRRVADEIQGAAITSGPAGINADLAPAAALDADVAAHVERASA